MSFINAGNAYAGVGVNPYLNTVNGLTSDLENLLRETSGVRAKPEEKHTCEKCKHYAEEATSYLAAIEVANGRIKVAKQRILDGKKETKSFMDELLRIKLDYARLDDEVQQLKENLVYYKKVSAEYRQALDMIHVQAKNVILGH